MNKISGIIPTNSRIASVDLSKASPTRKGHPNVGQPQVETSSRQIGPKASLREASGAYAQVMDVKQKNREQSVIEQKIQSEYFKDRMSPVVSETIETDRENLIAQTIPVESQEDVIQEVGSNLSVVA